MKSTVGSSLLTTITCALTFGVTTLMSVCVVADEAAPVRTSDDIEFFEKEVRPVLVVRCSPCHGTKKQEGGLRVDSREALLNGGDTSAAVVPRRLDSLLLKAVRREGEVKMPPDKKLPAREVRALEQWVRAGARWPEEKSQPVTPRVNEGKGHWAFQPIQRPVVPTVANDDWVRTPVDAFVAQRLATNGLGPSPPGDRQTLIRRVTYALTGLPPTIEEVDAFVYDDDPQSYQKLVERLLDSPQYGQHWGRYWLDVARYSDTKGYVYAREERFWTHAWTYRDWVVKALNDDMPYNRFLLLQLAADQVDDRQEGDLAAMGFLTLGRRFLGVRREVIDDRIDTVCRGTMALTVGCARCHDHKYDPIPTADYYSLYGVFDSCMEEQKVLADAPGDEAFRAELVKRQNAFRDKLQQYSDESTVRARQRTADYLFAQSELHKYPADGFDQVFQKTDLLPAFVRTWQRYLRAAKLRNDPVFAHWHVYAAFEPATFLSAATEPTNRLASGEVKTNSRVATAFATPPASFREVCERYGDVFAAVDKQWQECIATNSEGNVATALSDADAEAIRQVLYADGSPCRVPDGPISHCETFFDSGSLTELWKLQGNVDRWLNGSVEVPVALTLVDQATPVEPRVFQRGNPLKLGADIPRQFLSVLSGADCKPFEIGSGRLELARAIIDEENPLTARVIVNRVWARHFGSGLVTTPSDFGFRADPPSHPALLDWLASELVRQRWSLKELQRLIVMSSTFQQSSAAPADEELRRHIMQRDPDNRLLWRMSPRRLTFEELRDSLYQVTDSLDRRLGGKPQNLFAQPFTDGRTLYGLVDRQYFPSTLRVFDFASPDLHVPQRNETTVPQQALFFLNHALVLERAKALAKLTVAEDDPRSSVRQMFRHVYQRLPSDEEVDDAMSLLREVGESPIVKPPATAGDWTYGYGALDVPSERMTGFARLPHFTGEAWQGGPAWPDAKLGWVQLTADGGHPGNDRAHAAVRRWTAPRDMTITIRSRLTHEPAAGDGIRAFIVSSSQGILQSKTIHQKSEDLNVGEHAVRQGETIDFLVDIGKVLNSDQYLWNAIIEEHTASATWNSKTDFPSGSTPKLNPWEQLAHVLLCTNEFLFVD